MRSSKRIAFALAGLIALVPLSSSAAPIVIPSGVAPILNGNGTGLCIATAISTDVVADFGNLNKGNYTGSLNTFIEAHAKDRVESVVQTVLDLSNNNSSGLQSSYGDFINAMVPECKIGGCDFLVNDATTPFGARLRGFLNVTPDLAGQPIHIGLYADDAVSLTFFGKSGAIYPVHVRPPQLGLPTYRMSDTVIFQETGLYPLEILYVEIAEHAALEMSKFIGTFPDMEAPANQPPVTKLSDVGFTLFTPTAFSQTISGSPSYPDMGQCKQCDRQFVNLPGNNGCTPGYYCNEAALCAPCDSALLCGPTCSPCGGATPFCINSNGKLDCGGCRDDNDCKAGFRCDPDKHVCQQCNVDSDCDRGMTCENHTCGWCHTPDKCAGNSCNCCPQGTNPKPMQCATLPGQDAMPPLCVECTTDTECSTGHCDVLVGQCVDPPANNKVVNEQPGCCGESCAKCPADFPFCLPGPLGTACAQCRDDMDCSAGKYCLSGQCETCTVDKRCGKRCGTCSGDTPFCSGGQVADTAVCVRCTKDDECVGGKCDLTTHDCTTKCPATCDAKTPYCDGKACVECYADTQCPCGGTCHLDTHTCDAWCKGNGDCSGDEHCRWKADGNSKECAPGPMPDNAGCGGTLASACQGSIGSKGEDPVPITAIVALSMLALVSRRAKRGQS